jgi:16S rRNA (uracil1498-N3)-methyltransferase
VRRFYVAPHEFKGERVRISGEEAHHLRRVLRLGPGDEVDVFDGAGHEYRVELRYFHGDAVWGYVLEETTVPREAPIFVSLAQGLAKGEKMELVIQKATEIGVASVIPLHTARSVPRPGSGQARREERWQRIAREAAKQCWRTVVPAVEPLCTLPELVRRFSEYQAVLFFWEEEKSRHLHEVLATLTAQGHIQRLLLIVGPEGGFTPEEAQLVAENGAVSVTLGPRILRTETAGLVAASIILYELGDLG